MAPQVTSLFYLFLLFVTLGFTLPALAEPETIESELPQYTDDAHRDKKGGCIRCHELSDTLGEQGGVKRKIGFTKMMLLGKSAKRVEASDNGEAKASLAQAKNKIEQANAEFEAGNEASAQVFLAAAMKAFTTATQLVPSDNTIEKLRLQYQQRRAQLEVARLNHQRNFSRMVASNGEAAGIAYDEVRVEKLAAEALELAEKGEYQRANGLLTTARTEVQGAIRKMMDSQEIVYKLDIDTPEKEYLYELNKYLSYEELAPVAIERLKPSKGQQMLAKRVSERAQSMAEQARSKAVTKDYPDAIRMLQDATREIRKALKILGVPDLG